MATDEDITEAAISARKFTKAAMEGSDSWPLMYLRKRCMGY